MIRASIAAIALFAAPASASAPVYMAQPATSAPEGRLVVRDVIWRCDDQGCTAGRSPTRHALVCAGLARELGELRRFSVGGQDFDGDQLEACNRRAR